jgi:hypothetical protein
MTLYTIETDNRAVAITNDDEVVTRLNGSDPVLRETARHFEACRTAALGWRVPVQFAVGERGRASQISVSGW